MTHHRPPEPLEGHHDISGFECRSAEQTDWLRRFARQSAAGSTTRVFVGTEIDSEVFVAYYAWCMAQVVASDAPERLRKGAGRYPQPVALLARLGVDNRHERVGHAESATARDFYRHLVPEFEVSPTDDLHLVLLMKDIRRALR